MSSFSQNYNISCIHCEVTTLYFAIREQSWQNWSGLAAAEMKLNWTNSFLSDAWIEEFGNSSAFFFLNSFKCVNPACYILGSNFYIYDTVVIIPLRKEKYKSIRINSCCRKSTGLFTEVTIVNTYMQQYTILAIFLHTKLPRTITSCFFYSYPVTQFCIIKKSVSMLARFWISKHLCSAKTARKACWEMLALWVLRELSIKGDKRQPHQLFRRATSWIA